MSRSTLVLWRGRIDPSVVSRAAVLASITALSDGTTDGERSEIELIVTGSDLVLSVRLGAARGVAGPGAPITATQPTARREARLEARREVVAQPPFDLRIAIAVATGRFLGESRGPLALRIPHHALVRALRRREADVPNAGVLSPGDHTELLVIGPSVSDAPTGIVIDVPERKVRRTVLVVRGEPSVAESLHGVAHAGRQARAPMANSIDAEDLYEAGAIAGADGAVLVTSGDRAAPARLVVVGELGTTITSTARRRRPKSFDPATRVRGANAATPPSLQSAPELIDLSPRAARALALAMRATRRDTPRSGTASFTRLAGTDLVVGRAESARLRVAVADTLRVVPATERAQIAAAIDAIVSPAPGGAIHVRVSRGDLVDVVYQAQRAATTAAQSRETERLGPTDALVVRWDPAVAGIDPAEASASPPRRVSHAPRSGTITPSSIPRESAGIVKFYAIDRAGELRVSTMSLGRDAARGDLGRRIAFAVSLSSLAECVPLVGTADIDLEAWADVVRISDRARSRVAVIQTVPPVHLAPALRRALDDAHWPTHRAPQVLAIAAADPYRLVPHRSPQPVARPTVRRPRPRR